jgi:hypothetical protein
LVPFADNFTIGGVISLLIPGATLVAVAIWYTRTVLRREREREQLEEPAARPPGRGTSQATP